MKRGLSFDDIRHSNEAAEVYGKPDPAVTRLAMEVCGAVAQRRSRERTIKEIRDWVIDQERKRKHLSTGSRHIPILSILAYLDGLNATKITRTL